MNEQALSTRYNGLARLPTEVVSTLKKLSSSQLRIEFLNGVMQQIIDSGDGRQRSQFWDVRKLCLAEFQEPLPSAVRIALWAQYSRLCQEARKLKTLFDEQSAFTIQQIDQAIKALEQELLTVPHVVQAADLMAEIAQCIALRHNERQYSVLQKEISLLQLLALRVVDLKKEIYDADLRIKQKRLLFQQLNVVSDPIFSWKKRAIQAISALFMEDVLRFLQTKAHGLRDLFAMKEVLQQLQHCSKILTLTSKIFTQARIALSQCWDEIQKSIAEQKEVVHDRHEIFKNNKEKVLLALEEVDGKFLAGENVEEILHKIAQQINDAELSYNDKRMLRAKIDACASKYVQDRYGENKSILTQQE